MHTNLSVNFFMARYPNIDYKGGHPKMPTPGNVIVEVDDFDKCIRIIKKDWSGENFVLIDNDEILNISLDEKTNRSLGKAAAGAVIGGVLTGGIGLLAGGLLGGRKKDVSNVYITIAPNGKEVDIILKAGKHAENIYAAIAGIL